MKFLSRAQGYTLFVTASEAVFAGRDGSVERMKFVGANPAPRVEPLEKQPGISNYFIGNIPTKWHTKIPNYAKFALREVYPGIDLVFYGNGNRLEYDWIIAPGADPSRIRVRWETPGEISETSAGSLLLSASLEQSKPAISQEGRPVAGGYQLRGKEVRFEIPKYERSKPLIIDPVVFIYSTYLGGTGEKTIAGPGGDVGYSIAVDSSGNAYVAGTTASTNFPTVKPLQGSNFTQLGVTAFVSKINPTGTALVYSTYLGGNFGEGAFAIAVDAAGDAFVTGNTYSTNFPVVSPIQATLNSSTGGVFVTKLNPSGSMILYSTYLNGSGDIQDGYYLGDTAYGIAVDSEGNAYVAGEAVSQNFPILHALQSINRAYASIGANAFVSKINAAGSALVYSTYLGGTVWDEANSIAVDSSGNAYLAGATYSSDFPAVNPIDPSNRAGNAPTGFVAKIDSSGSSLMYSTYLGGSQTGFEGPMYDGDEPYSIAVDSSGSAYVAGVTMSLDFPVANAYQSAIGANGSASAFVTKFNPAGTALAYSTFLGSYSQGFGISVDSFGDAFVTGSTQARNFPVLDALQPNLNISGSTNVVTNAFVTVFNPAGSGLIYSTYVGGNATDSANSIAIDKSGDAYITGATTSLNFPTSNPLQPHDLDTVNAPTAFISVIGAPPVFANPPTSLTITGGDNQTGFLTSALAQPLTVSVTSASGAGVAGITVNFALTAGSGSVSTSTAQTNSAGVATVTLTLGLTAGTLTVTASIPGSTVAPVTFSESALTSATCPIAAPVITSVNYATDFGGFSNFSSGSYLEVKGSNLAIDSRQWATADFEGANAPTSLDGTQVSLDSIPGYVSYISAIQINVQAPADTATGQVPIIVTNCAGSSNAYLLQKTALSPGMLAPASFNVGKQYLAALFAADLSQGIETWVGNTGFIGGANSRPARPGDTIIVYGLSFGDVTPPTPPGVIASGITSLTGLSISFGQTPATLSYAGLYPGYVGLYEFFLTVPNVADGDYQINVIANGTPVPQTFFLTVQQ